MSADVHAYAHQLRSYATHFVMRDWCYTRNLGRLKHIRYDDDFSGYDHPWRRLKRTVLRFLRTDRIEREVFGRRFPLSWSHPLAAIRGGLRTGRHLPDGVLDNGGVITFWEETGEYLQYVQPSVGALLADLMDAHPDLPEVQAIADEMKRINDDYGVRAAAEGWNQ